MLIYVQKDVAQKSGWEVVWLKHLAQELESENPGEFTGIPSSEYLSTTTVTIGGPKPVPTTAAIVDRLLISRLELDPQTMS